MLGRLESGASIGVHTHEGNSETIFIIKGKGKVYYDGTYETVTAGQCHYCPMGHEHSLINDSDSDLVFYAVVPQHE
jgi:quercetin dioxygenase-like cupin family protein